MNIDEAIAHAREVAEGCPAEDRQCAYQHDKLADWLEELKGYRASGLTPEEIDEILHKSYGPLHKKLGQWIAAEKDGRMMVLPCKVGDLLYEIDLPEYGVITCKALEVHAYIGPDMHVQGAPMVSAVNVSVEVIDGHGKGSGYTFEILDFGKTVFLSREEAEASLAERKGCPK